MASIDLEDLAVLYCVMFTLTCTLVLCYIIIAHILSDQFSFGLMLNADKQIRFLLKEDHWLSEWES